MHAAHEVSSPFVQFSTATLEEHQNTLLRLRHQVEQIARALADLDGDDVHDERQRASKLHNIQCEEDDFIRRLQAADAMCEDRLAGLRENEILLAQSIEVSSTAHEHLQREYAQLEDMEQELLEMERGVKGRLACTREQIKMFANALRQGLDVLETDRHEVRLIAATASRTLSRDPVEAVRALSPNRGAHIPHTSSHRYTSPTRGEGRSPAHSPVKEFQQSSASQMPPVTQNTFHVSSRTPTQRAPHVRVAGNSDLLTACSRVPLDATEVTQLLREHQDSVNQLDELDNTPLHLACMNPSPNLDAIHALLLAGSNTSAKNSSGFTAFHLATLNAQGDPDHKLKRFLIFKGAQNPNQRTSRGETALHLCAEHDRHYDSLVFLSGAGVDPEVSALLSGPDGNPRRMTALDVARSGGSRSARNADYLSHIASQ